MRNRSLLTFCVTVTLATLVAACDLNPVSGLCFDWTDSGGCQNNGNGSGGGNTPFHVDVGILLGAGRGDTPFSPNPFTTTVAAGAGPYPPVTWVNYDSVPHHLVSDTPLFDTGALAPNTTINIRFPTAGTYKYHCTIHPFMVGTITVNP